MSDSFLSLGQFAAAELARAVEVLQDMVAKTACERRVLDDHVPFAISRQVHVRRVVTLILGNHRLA